MEKKLIITVGRQFGSGGKAVALELGKKLGIPVFDNELLTKAAQDSGFSAEFFARSDEKRRFFSLSSIFTTEYSSQTNSYMSDKDIFSMQCETIRSIAEHGPAIIVGRCADYVLRELDCTLDVFITAPQAVRVGRIVERLGLSDEKALELMERKDKGREEYYNYYTFGNWGVASTYDLCLDSSILGVEGTADFIIEYARRAGLL
ncbi:MAG: cytidylate kinase-like family protein [Bacteroidales bacterium]|nr:cytidylate kinase-like family protein [Bacteroidales bacterium]MBQ8744042.1 cytidylate kinase-like family protein [Mailhella sp.]